MEKRLNHFDNLEIEIGSGNGKFIVEHALERPETHFVGVEYSHKAAKKAVSKAYKRSIKNLTIIFGEANETIDKFLKDKYYFDKAYLNFPDPWPKKRHGHRRIFTHNFLKRIHSILKPNAVLHVVTDDAVYAKEIMCPTFEESDIFKNALNEKYVHTLENYKQTLYENKMRAKGLDIHFFVYNKI